MKIENKCEKMWKLKKKECENWKQKCEKMWKNVKKCEIIEKKKFKKMWKLKKIVKKNMKIEKKKPLCVFVICFKQVP